MWDFQMELDERSKEPLFLQIAGSLSEAIREGRLVPGERIPGSRKLAKQLQVHRNTVLAAYEELHTQGWLYTEQARGTFVAIDIPSQTEWEEDEAIEAPRAGVRPYEVGFPFYSLPSQSHRAPLAEGMLALEGGWADMRECPTQELSRAYRRALQRRGVQLLDYGDPAGWEPLRASIAKMLSTRRGLRCEAADVLLTRGSQMGMYLSTQALIRPGDVVAVEAYGYQPAWQALRMAGAQLMPIEVDQEGLRVEQLEELLSRVPVRAVYVTPHHQYPTLSVLSAGRRMQLLALAQSHHFAIFEDDYDHEFHYDGRPVMPLASSDEAGVVLYIGSLSKVVAPGLRIGYVVAPGAFLQALTSMRRCIDRQGSQVEEAALAELMEEGDLQRSIRKTRRLYKERRDTLAQALKERFVGQLEWDLPKGGMAIWARVAEGIDPDRWAAQGVACGVLFSAASRYTFTGAPEPFLRLGFARHNPDELIEAVSRMAKALKAL